MSFTSELWNAVSPIYAAILRHPFLTGSRRFLSREGSALRREDALYLL